MNDMEVFDPTSQEVKDQPPTLDYVGSFPLYQKKMWKLMGEGYSEKEAEEMCKPNPMEHEQLMAQVMDMQKRELRNLARLDKMNKKAPNKRYISIYP